MLLLLALDGVDGEVADVQLGAVSGQAGMYSCAHTGTQVTADGGSADQENVGLECVDHRGQRVGVGLCPIFLQFGIVDQDHAVCAVLAQFHSQILYFITHQNSRNGCVQILCQIFAFTDQFQGNTAHRIVNLLCKNIYALIFF